MFNRDKNNQQYTSRVDRDFAPHHYRLHIWRKIFFTAMLLGCLGVIGGGCLFFHYVASSPTINKQALSSDDSTKIYDANNHLIANLNSKNRQYIPYKKIPPKFINALTSIEDRKFFTDKGVEPTRIIGAALHDTTSNGVQGGSTLTQQLVKMSVFSTSAQDRTLKRKAQEAYLAMKLTRKIPKDKIFEYYANKVFMDNNNYGVQTAAQYYFGKNLSQLNLPQTALIAGMPQSPVQYDPYRFPKVAKERRNRVLQAMASNHKITATQANDAENTPVQQGLVPKNAPQHRENKAKQAKERVIDGYLNATLQDLAKKGYRAHAGLKVYTNMNMKNQQKMYDLANNDNSVGFPNNQMQIGGALVQAKSGKVNAMLSGRKLKQPFGLNRAMQTGRSSGSTAKPFEDYAPAMQYLGYGTNHIVSDSPFSYGQGTPLYDWDHHYEGDITLAEALIRSRNIPAVRTLQHVGLNRARHFMVHGFDYDPGSPAKRQYSLQNGINLDISPLQEAEIYATFSDNGVYHAPSFIRKIKESNGTVHNYGIPKGRQAMSPGVAYAIQRVLEKTADSQDGDPNAHISGVPANGVKSGTTQYAEDAPYRGSLPNYAAEDSWISGSVGTGSGGTYALSLWNAYDNPMKTGHYVSANGINIVQKYYAKMMKFALDQPGVHPKVVRPKDALFDATKGYFEK